MQRKELKGAGGGYIFKIRLTLGIQAIHLHTRSLGNFCQHKHKRVTQCART